MKRMIGKVCGFEIVTIFPGFFTGIFENGILCWVGLKIAPLVTWGLGAYLFFGGDRLAARRSNNGRRGDQKEEGAAG